MNLVIPKLRMSLRYYINQAKTECAKSKYSPSCKIAYENVEEISATLAKKRKILKKKT
jgi:hypothetical protein